MRYNEIHAVINAVEIQNITRYKRSRELLLQTYQVMYIWIFSSRTVPLVSASRLIFDYEGLRTVLQQ